VSVTLTANEGPAYAWEAAEWKDNVALGVDDLGKLMGMRSGDLANALTIDAGLRQVAKAYGRKGYIQAQTLLTPRLNDENRRAIFEIRVVEGRQFRMGTVEVHGFSERDAATLSSRWRLKPGDIYDASYSDEFSSKELAPLRRAGKPTSLQYDVDPTAGVVNVRIVLQP
jgi:outer membrane protein assembly factor BamA